jgi:hypothetical protein
MKTIDLKRSTVIEHAAIAADNPNHTGTHQTHITSSVAEPEPVEQQRFAGAGVFLYRYRLWRRVCKFL